MKKALISPQENNRICEVCDDEFPVALPLFFADCPDNTTTDWTYSGGAFSPPAPAPVVIPTTVSMRQARLALLQFGLLATVDAAIASGGETDRITWEYATEVSRSDALVSNMAAALSLNDEALDSLFTLAASL